MVSGYQIDLGNDGSSETIEGLVNDRRRLFVVLRSDLNARCERQIDAYELILLLQVLIHACNRVAVAVIAAIQLRIYAHFHMSVSMTRSANIDQNGTEWGGLFIVFPDQIHEASLLKKALLMQVIRVVSEVLRIDSRALTRREFVQNVSG